jgi:predicted RNase H-like nuclease (RuvC/YqgF family)
VRKKGIVGIDPGLYTAVVILDLKGNKIFERVERDMGEEKIVKIIADVCDPVIIATDVEPVPHLIQKISSRFNAKLYKPERELREREKYKISREQNPHLRDAYAACIKAFRKYQNVFRRIDKIAKTEEEAERMKENVVKGLKRSDLRKV